MPSFPYFPHTDGDLSAMMERIGVKSLDELYSDVPKEFIFKGEYNLAPAKSEQEVRDFFQGLADKCPKAKVFVGQGAYDHYTPSVIPYLTSRSEFLTAYTPYQCEISQGTLRYIFEYQSMICALTGLDVSNASMYDGPTAAAEASRMAINSTKGKTTVAVSSTLLPQVRDVVKTYAKFYGTTIVEIKEDDKGQTSLEALKALAAEGNLAGAIVPSIGRHGIIENHSAFAETLHSAGALLIEYCDPSALAVVKTPKEWGADIAIGDGQSLGIPLCYGGPYVGFMATTKEYMRKLPGRIVGQTLDKQGRRSFVLTLQAREQHIRREKATSNICSNESLMALWVTIYLSIMGPKGLKDVNEQSYEGAHYLYGELLKTGKFEKIYDSPFIKEFVLRPVGVDANTICEALASKGYFAAFPTEEGYASFCVTEKRTKKEIDGLVKTIREI